MIDITNLLKIAVDLIFLLISLYVIPWLKEKKDNEEWQKKYRYVEIGVKAAEQIYKESGMGKFKKDYVWKFLASKGYSVNEAELDNMIESAVLNLHLEMEKE